MLSDVKKIPYHCNNSTLELKIVDKTDPQLKMNAIYIGKFFYTPMINSKYKFENVSVATDEGPSLKLALSEGRSRGNIES